MKTIVALFLVCLCSPAFADAPSFDCGGAKTEIEKAICSDHDLAEADLELAKAYHAFIASASPHERQSAIRDQIAWLQQRDSACASSALKTFPIESNSEDDNDPSLPGLGATDPVVTCLSRLYSARISDLQRPVLAPNEFAFVPTSQPYLPRLIENSSPGVCRSFVRALSQDYASRHPWASWEDVPFNWLPHQIPPSSGIFVLPWRTDSNGLFSVKLDSENHRQVIYLDSQPAAGDEIRFSAYVRAQPPDEKDASELQYQRFTDLRMLSSGGWKLLAASINDFGPSFSIVWIKGRYFLMRDGSDLPITDDMGFPESVAPFTTSVPPWGVALYTITPQGLGHRECLVAATSLNYRGGVGWRTGEPAPAPPITADLPDKLGKYISALDDAIGNSGFCQGTMWPGVQANTERRRRFLEYKTVLQPWDMTGAKDLNELPVEADSKTVFAEIDGWRQETLFNFRAFRQLISGQSAVIDELAKFYRSGFGVDKRTAALVAKRALQHLIVGSFTTHRSEALERGEEDPNVGASDDLAASTAGLPAVLAAKSQWSREDIALWDADANSPHTEPILFYALERVDVMRQLIGEGADVNKANWFGKTALMYAAQWNLADAVHLLIKSNADVNQTTVPADSKDQCLPAPSIYKRTALMYAVENAKSPVIQALIDAGAERNAVDSAKHGVLWHLMRNQTLSPAEREHWVSLLSKS